MSVDLARYVVPPTGYFGNHAAHNERIEVLPLSSAMGAEIRGVELAAIDDEQFAEIEAALYRHKMIYFRDQSLSLEDQERLTVRFGPFGVDAYTGGVEGHENVQRVLKEANAKLPMVFGGSWHTDSAFLPRPPAVSMLYGVEVPPYGGDTWWANTELAYGFLSDTMKRLIAGLRVHMSASKVVAALKGTADPSSKMNAVASDLEQERMMIDGSFHPLVRTHSVTGGKALYVDQTYATGIEGMSRPESAALIGFLTEHSTQPVFTCRLRWEDRTFVMWDNRSSVHHAFNDYDGFRREMYRTIVEGEVPS